MVVIIRRRCSPIQISSTNSLLCTTTDTFWVYGIFFTKTGQNQKTESWSQPRSTRLYTEAKLSSQTSPAMSYTCPKLAWEWDKNTFFLSCAFPEPTDPILKCITFWPLGRSGYPGLTFAFLTSILQPMSINVCTSLVYNGHQSPWWTDYSCIPIPSLDIFILQNRSCVICECWLK